jgi:hypothetical protein
MVWIPSRGKRLIFLRNAQTGSGVPERSYPLGKVAGARVWPLIPIGVEVNKCNHTFIPQYISMTTLSLPLL